MPRAMVHAAADMTPAEVPPTAVTSASVAPRLGRRYSGEHDRQNAEDHEHHSPRSDHLLHDDASLSPFSTWEHEGVTVDS
jgi:hypothetical protein